MSLSTKIKNTLKYLKQGRVDFIVYEIKKIITKNPALPIPFPAVLCIEPTNICNLKCPACSCGNGRDKRPKRNMSLNEFKHIIDQIKGKTEKIIFFNYGEPFINKQAPEMIKYAVDSGIEVITSTNGMFFDTDDICERVVKSGLNEIILCLDGIDQKTLEIYRKGADLEKIINGFERLQNAKKKLNSKKPKVELQFILMKHNISQQDKVIELAKKINADIFVLKSCGISTSEPNFEELSQKYLPDCESNNRFYKDANGRWRPKGERKNQCQRVLHSAIIICDGSVVPCCYDLLSENVMGNIFEQSLKKIWNSKKYDNFRKKIFSNRKSIPICIHCPESRLEMKIAEKEKLTGT